MACLDTSLLIDAAGRGGNASSSRSHPTRFNVAELWVGVERSRDREAEIQAVEGILSPLAVLDFDESAARVFGRITAHLAAAGRPRGDMDVLIASVVLVHGERIVTGNARHFEGIPGLAVEDY